MSSPTDTTGSPPKESMTDKILHMVGFPGGEHNGSTRFEKNDKMQHSSEMQRDMRPTEIETPRAATQRSLDETTNGFFST
ncbi:hypothetical protein MNV49_000662 [Pseudohyphozyma bogoriensis]|nr:hypothetical protein MNV49_000662 [Pseudohyphozyma bogoriensis]